jgi:hypothetical protein
MFRFTIRDVLWLTVVVGMATGAFATHSRMSADLVASEAARTKAENSLDATLFVMDELMKDFDAVHPGWRRAKWQTTPEFQAEVAKATARTMDRFGPRNAPALPATLNRP